MFRIGDFSKLSRVSIKALRYYDELGLLKPARVDEFTSYRYYSTEQLSRLNRILALKDMGLSLTQIAQLLDQQLTPEQIHGMLRLKQVELRQEIAEGRMRLERIEAWLQQFEEKREVLMPAYDVVLKSVPARRVAETRGVAANWSVIGPTLDHLFDVSCDYVITQGAKWVQPGIAVYYDQEHRDTDIHVGACIGFEGNLQDGEQAGEQVRIVELPAVATMASVIHRGPFSTMDQAYNAIFKWIEANGYHICGPNRELNLEYERGGDQSKYVTEIQFPVEKNS